MKGRLAKATFALAAALVFVSGPARATESVTFDGVWWQGLTRGEKIVALEGILAGIDSGYSSGWWGGGSYILNAYMTSQQRAAVMNRRFRTLTVESDAERAAAPAFSKTFGTYVDEIDVWYEAHPKRTSVEPVNLLEGCFANKPIISSCDDVGSDLDK